MEQMTFTSGRYRFKTFQYVLENDRTFCEQVMNDEKSERFREFRKFLESKCDQPERTGKISDKSLVQPKINEQGVPYFLQALTPNMLAELNNIIKESKVTTKNVHSSCHTEKPNNSFLIIFYHFFVEKLIFSLRDEDAHNTYIENYASVFPFKVSRSVNFKNLPVFDLFDEKFKNQIQTFLDSHFDNIHFQDIVPLLLSNIHAFQEEVCEKDDFCKNSLNTLLEEMLTTCPEKLKSIQRNNFHLKNFPRLNKEGALRYRSLYQVYEDIVQIYKVTRPKCNTSIDYFMNLPEINCSEMFALLNENVFRNARDTYQKLFEKYLLFFVRAISKERNSVFFIDDVLYECLKSLQSYKKFRGSIFDILYDLSMISLIYLRKTCHVGRRFGNEKYKVNEENLLLVEKYIRNFPGIETAVLNAEVQTKCLQFPLFLSTKDTCLDMRFGEKYQYCIRNFHEPIVMAALCPYKVKRFVLYNPRAGTENVIEIPPITVCKKIYNFVRKYNSWNSSMQQSDDKFLTRGLEKFFNNSY